MKGLFAYSFATASFFVYQLSAVDFTTIADKYGVPVAFSMILFGFVFWLMRKEDAERSHFLQDIRDANDKQVEFLQSLLLETRKQNVITNNGDEKK